MEPALKQRKEKYEKLKITLQPLPIIIGRDLDNIEASYVNVNNVLYNIDNPLKAVDICFKIYHVLNASYPVECEHVWLFLQKLVYAINTPYDKNFVSVNSFISDITNI